jgi:hypothetical protein
LAEFIPVVGPAKSAIRNFGEGSWGWGLFNTGMAITDFAAVKALASGLLRGAFKVGSSHSWAATQKWYKNTRGIPTDGSPIHHWAVYQNSAVGKMLPKAIVNQPLNLNPLPNASYHSWVHQQGWLGQMWYGSPAWAKAAIASTGGRAVETVACK